MLNATRSSRMWMGEIFTQYFKLKSHMPMTFTTELIASSQVVSAKEHRGKRQELAVFQFLYSLSTTTVRTTANPGIASSCTCVGTPLGPHDKYRANPSESTDPPPQMSLLTPIPIDEISANLSLGVLYIGSTIAAVHVFYGITILQTVVYYKRNPNDAWLFRYAVAFLWILDTVQVALSTHVLYFYLIKSFGNYAALLRIIWSVPLQLLMNMLIICGVQALYALRIWKLGRHFHMVLPWFIFLAVAATFGTGVYVMYDTYTLTTFTTPEISTIKNTYQYAAWPNTLTFIATDLVLPKLYINSLLAMLNSRRSSGGNMGRRVPRKMIRFAPHNTESGLADSGQMVVFAAPESVLYGHTGPEMVYVTLEGTAYTMAPVTGKIIESAYREVPPTKDWSQASGKGVSSSITRN
ncbi:hypothetical protein IW261DRAFT_1556942 [Armillaria novae-zelandiae]|uniref:Uncharacterized protein n=1 Tax=Armillaria novae-zelandiae TaxID=153914 RepID=A0AA39PQ47_9AGAR|nr:hypothetical protein IW261DRAFT_1556942 [Armillaria novae-zelandiae]